MALVVDTCVLLDLRLGDAVHGPPAVACLSAHAAQGLLICPPAARWGALGVAGYEEPKAAKGLRAGSRLP